MQLRRYEARDVGDVEHQECADLFGNLMEGLGVDFARIGTGTADDHLRLVFHRLFLDVVHIDAAIFFPDAVVDEIEKFTREIDRRTVRQMTTVREVHGEDRIAGLEHGKINGHIGL